MNLYCFHLVYLSGSWYDKWFIEIWAFSYYVLRLHISWWEKNGGATLSLPAGGTGLLFWLTSIENWGRGVGVPHMSPLAQWQWVLWLFTDGDNPDFPRSLVLPGKEEKWYLINAGQWWEARLPIWSPLTQCWGKLVTSYLTWLSDTIIAGVVGQLITIYWGWKSKLPTQFLLVWVRWARRFFCGFGWSRAVIV
jgi:hypothetical protein